MESDWDEEFPEEETNYTMEELVDSIAMLPEGFRLVFNMYVVD